jgi:hypothetical protein
LYEPGDDVVATYFPEPGTIISLVVRTLGIRSTEAIMIGCEGAAGGVVSAGHRPASTRMVVTTGGGAIRVETDRLEEAKGRSPRLHDVFSRYADLLLAQAMQSVACSAMHTLDQRLCRWLLMMHDRVATPRLAVTQGFLSAVLGVQRTTISATAQELQSRGFIHYRRGQILIVTGPVSRLSPATVMPPSRSIFMESCPPLSAEGRSVLNWRSTIVDRLNN